MISRTFHTLFLLLISLFIVFSCDQDSGGKLSPLGAMNIPINNIQSESKIELGKQLFFDKRLSKDSTISCATCHIPSIAFANNQTLGRGIGGKSSMRNVPSLYNVGYAPTLMYDAKVPNLEMQAIVPIQDHHEMDLTFKELIERLSSDSTYDSLSNKAFNKAIDPWVITRSLASFQRTLISDNSKFDQFQAGKVDLTEEEFEGWNLFSNVLYCTTCHPAPHFTTYLPENNGLYPSYDTIQDKGRYRINHDSLEIGYFKTPSLRNVTLTAPYMHDGSIKTLEGVLSHYAKGGEKPPLQHQRIHSFSLSDKEQQAILSFLNTLTDTSSYDYGTDFE